MPPQPPTCTLALLFVPLPLPAPGSAPAAQGIFLALPHISSTPLQSKQWQ